MNRYQNRVNPSEKNRMRNEIDEQVRDFLQRGGKIDVLAASQRRLENNAIGSVWHTDELPEPTE